MWRLGCRSSLHLPLLIFCLFLSSIFPRFFVGASDAGVQVRLVNGQTPYEGRLEVNYQGLWGTVCNLKWTVKNANVVCRQLGYPAASQAGESNQFGVGTGPILLCQVSCRGDESSIDQCNHKGWFVHHGCLHDLDVGVSCDLTILPAVRLVSGSTTHEGRVEVYFKCQWGTICDYGWGPEEADIVCRQLGYPSATHAWSGAHFGQGSLPIILSKIACNGNESSLAECNHGPWFNDQYCKHDQDAGVTCETSILSTVLVRLVNGSTPYEGRVEVYQEGEWGTICGDNEWGLKNAQVICRQLGYPTASRAWWRDSHFGRGAGPTLWGNVTCDGNESSIAECGHGSWVNGTCTHPGVAAVRCGEGPLMIEESQTIPVRLVNGAGPHEGRVEVFHKCFWGTLSGHFLTIREANVICRQLGFPSAYRALRFGQFGQGTGPILLTNVICRGDEASIDQCSLREWFQNKRGLLHDNDVGVICDLEPQLPPPVRLVNGNTPEEGRVEVYHQCFWGTICGFTWTLQSADVICRQLGYPSATHAWQRAHFGQGTGLLLLSVGSCNGSESNIMHCSHWGWLNEICSHAVDVGVTCSKRIGLNSPSQVRLVNGTSPYEGRLEVFYKDQWGSVCSKGWSILEANVICQQLHYPPATRVWQGDHFGHGQGRILLDNVTCIGNETSIDQCYYRDWSTQNCSHGEDVGVTCGEGSEASELLDVTSQANSSHAAVRLAGGQTPNEGRVEIFYKCKWGRICNSGWSIRSADVVCRQLGYPSATQAWHWEVVGKAAGPAFLDKVQCNGSESSIDQCDHSGWLTTNNCNIEAAGVTCDIETPPPAPVRLANSSLPYEGRVELFYRGQWGVISSRSWSIEMANIVCRQLGYPSATKAWPGDRFRSGVKPALLMILTCRGNEESIDKCDHLGWFNTPLMFRGMFTDSMYDLGVTCTQKMEVHLPGSCATATSNSTDFGILTWPAATAGETVSSVERCPLTTMKAGSPRAVRECLPTDPPLWGNYSYDSCGEVIDDVEEQSTQLHIKEASTITTPVKISLSFKTQVACVVSIAAFVFTLVVNLTTRKLWNTNRKAHHISIHFSLSVVAIYGIYLRGVDKASELQSICTMISASLHYFTLTTMIWMTVEVRDIWCNTLKVSPEFMTRDLIWPCLVAWGSPVVVVLVTLMTPDDSYLNENYCFISFGLPMYLGVFTPMGILIIINIIMYLLTLHGLLRLQEVSRVRQIAKRLQSAVGVSALMSLTWCFGFLVIATSNPTYEVIFCTVSSVQAVYVCFMCCVQQEEVCRIASRLKCRFCAKKQSPGNAPSLSLHCS